MSAIVTRLRSFHVADMAVFDWVATGVAAAAIARWAHADYLATFFVLVLCAIVLHAALGVPTRLNAYLGLAKKEDVYARRAEAVEASVRKM